jgi:Ca2+-dependent lipid-binding protein
MDPYVKIKCGSTILQSEVHENGGKNPHWNQALKFNISTEDIVHIEVWDKDVIKHDDLVLSSAGWGN